MESEKIHTFQRLTQSYKQQFAFRLSVPSFIYPAGYFENAQMLAPYVDEIELLLLESCEGSLPSGEEIEALASLAANHNISYNVHLPTDLDFANANKYERQQAAERIAMAINSVRPLAPTTHTLHLPFKEENAKAPTIDNWIARNAHTLKDILEISQANPQDISIETLDYPPVWFGTLVAEIDLAVCIDMGHMLRYGYDLEEVWGMFSDRTSMIHLHGVYQSQDHLALDQMSAETKTRVKKCLNTYAGGLSIEVFSFDRLNASLPCLAQMFPQATTRNDV